MEKSLPRKTNIFQQAELRCTYQLDPFPSITKRLLWITLSNAFFRSAALRFTCTGQVLEKTCIITLKAPRKMLLKMSSAEVVY